MCEGISFFFWTVPQLQVFALYGQVSFLWGGKENLLALKESKQDINKIAGKNESSQMEGENISDERVQPIILIILKITHSELYISSKLGLFLLISSRMSFRYSRSRSSPHRLLASSGIFLLKMRWKGTVRGLVRNET